MKPTAQEIIDHCKMDTLDFVNWYSDRLKELKLLL